MPADAAGACVPAPEVSRLMWPWSRPEPLQPEIQALMESVRPVYPGAIPLDPKIRDLDVATASLEMLKEALAICNYISGTEYPETVEGTHTAMNKRTEIEAEIERRLGRIICD